MLLTGCAALRWRPRGPLVPVDPPALEDDLDIASLRTAIARNRPAAARSAGERLLAILDANPDPRARRDAVVEAFRVLRVRDPLLLTAYYEPELTARLAPDDTFRHPLYARPPDLVEVDPRELDRECACRRVAGRLEGGRLAPYPTRGEIDAGALANRGLELAWAADPIDVFVLHVQGSGLLHLEDGRLLGIRYAGTNGRPYRSIAHALEARGLLAKGRGSMPEIRRAFASLAPEEQAAVLATDERYTFFRLAEGGAVGSLGAELTPERSIATDPQLVPPGTLAYLSSASARRFVVSQDTGAAIRGAHADLFLGPGPDAEARAGRMRERGALYLLEPR